MPSLILWMINNWKAFAVVLALVLVAYGNGYVSGARNVQAQWDSALLKQNERNLITNTEVSNDYAKKMANLRKRYDALRLRKASGVFNANPASGTHAATPAAGLSGGVGEDADTLMFDADANTQQLMALQEWIRAMQ